MTTRSWAVVGASLAGARAAQALRSHGFDGRLHLIGAEAHAPYDRPPLSKQLLAGTVQDTALEPEESWAQAQIDLHLGQPAVSLDRTRREVVLADGTRIGADQVLLTTGGRPRRLDVPGAHLPGVFCLRTVEDARAIRDRLTSGARLVVVGAGFIGAEVAAGARLLGCDVTLVEVAQVPLHRVLGERMGRYYAEVHRDHGVAVRTGLAAVEMRGEDRVRQVVLSDGSVLDADLVVVGIGLVPATELAEGIGAQVDNGIVVDELCRTSVPGVFAAGDVANHPNQLLGQRVRLEHWRNAQNQAAAAAASMLGAGTPFREVPWFWSDQYDLNLQMAGHPGPGDDTVRRGSMEDHSFSVFYLREGRVRAVLAVNRPKDVRAGMDLIAARAAVNVRALGDTGVDLRRLARSLTAA